MGLAHSPKIVTDGLVLCLDARDRKSYPGSGNTWKNRSSASHNFTLDSSGITFNSDGYFTLTDGGATSISSITTNTTCTLVFWIKTTDTQSLFWKGQSTSYYLGAYRSGNKEYHNGFGSPDFYMDTVGYSNIYDNIRDDEWHMVEFKNVNMSAITQNHFNQYGSYTFGNRTIGAIYMYDKNLTAAESSQNFNAIKSRFGL